MNSPYQNARAPTEISNFPDKLLVRLIVLIYEKFEEIDIEEIDISEIINNLDLVNPALRYFVISNPNFNDYSYLCELVNLNVNPEIPIERPKLKILKVLHTEDYRESGTRYYETIIPSYCVLNDDNLSDMREDEFYLYWDGKLLNNEVYDSETDDDTVVEITVVGTEK